MFQNVREKAHLAYVASSNYQKPKNIIIVNSGIDIENYDKALKIIKEQLEDMENGIFTLEEIENAKKGIIDSAISLNDEQDTQITYYLGQEISENECSIEEYMQKINNVTKEDIIKIAKSIKINTIYFLRN